MFKISEKFLHPEEKLKVRPDRVLEDLHVYWGAKEALFKIWKKGEAEPSEWTMTATDPHPIKSGSPALYVYATTDCMFDNVSVNFND